MTEIRFRLPALPNVTFVRRPVSSPPGDGTVCFVDDGDARGWKKGQAAALYRDGKWTNGAGNPLKFEPTYWTTMEKNHGPKG